jgi:hypothetical protein
MKAVIYSLLHYKLLTHTLVRCCRLNEYLLPEIPGAVFRVGGVFFFNILIDFNFLKFWTLEHF